MVGPCCLCTGQNPIGVCKGACEGASKHASAPFGLFDTESCVCLHSTPLILITHAVVSPEDHVDHVGSPGNSHMTLWPLQGTARASCATVCSVAGFLLKSPKSCPGFVWPRFCIIGAKAHGSFGAVFRIFSMSLACTWRIRAHGTFRSMLA